MEIVTLKKDCRRIEPLDLTLAEAKQLFKTIHHCLLTQQIDVFLASRAYCAA